jgi:hypothetical protein
MPARMAASLIGLGALLTATPSLAQTPASSASSLPPPVLHFSKPANMLLPVAPSADSGNVGHPASDPVKDAASSTSGATQGVMYFDAVPPVTTPPLPKSTMPSRTSTPLSASIPSWQSQTSSGDSSSSLPAQADKGSQPAPDVSSSKSWSDAAVKELENNRLRSVYYQPPMPGPRGPGQEAGEPLEYHLQLEPPGLQRLIRLDSEKQLDERMRQEARERPVPERIQFPEEPVISREKYARRHFPAADMKVEPSYLCYSRLYFEERNAERYGWDLGIVQPVVSAGAFFWDVATLPYHLATDPCRFYDSNAGQCLPGDPVPYLLYPPELSMTGAVAEAGTVFALLAIFP